MATWNRGAEKIADEIIGPHFSPSRRGHRGEQTRLGLEAATGPGRVEDEGWRVRDEDGYSLMRRIRSLAREHGGTVPAVALTAFVREEDRLKALAAGFTTHLGKPVNAEVLTFTAASRAARNASTG